MAFAAMNLTNSRVCMMARPTVVCQKAMPSALKVATSSSFIGTGRPQGIISRLPRSRMSAPVQAASSEGLNWEVDGQGLDGKNDYSGALAVAGFVATHFYTKFAVSSALFLNTVATLQLAAAAVTIITRRSVGDPVSSIVGPAILAVYTLGITKFNYLQAAIALFGYYLSEHLEGPTTIPFWVWGATLAGALYAGYGTEWYVAGWALLTASRLVRGLSGENKTIGIFNIPILGACAYALAKEQTVTLTLLFFLGHTIWSGVKVLDALTTRAS